MNKSILLLEKNLKPCTHIARSLLVVDLQLDVQMACNDLQKKFQHVECITLIIKPISF